MTDDTGPVAFYCEHRHQCKCQGMYLHQGLAWGRMPTAHEVWRNCHERECGGRLLPLYTAPVPPRETPDALKALREAGRQIYSGGWIDHGVGCDTREGGCTCGLSDWMREYSKILGIDIRHWPAKTLPPPEDPELRLIKTGEQPYGIRDRGGYLLLFPRLHKYEGQEERYKQEVEARFRLADQLMVAIQRGAHVAHTHFTFLVKRPQDKEPWPLIFDDRERAEQYPDRSSDVMPVTLFPIQGD